MPSSSSFVSPSCRAGRLAFLVDVTLQVIALFALTFLLGCAGNGDRRRPGLRLRLRGLDRGARRLPGHDGDADPRPHRREARGRAARRAQRRRRDSVSARSGPGAERRRRDLPVLRGHRRDHQPALPRGQSGSATTWPGPWSCASAHPALRPPHHGSRRAFAAVGGDPRPASAAGVDGAPGPPVPRQGALPERRGAHLPRPVACRRGRPPGLPAATAWGQRRAVPRRRPGRAEPTGAGGRRRHDGATRTPSDHRALAHARCRTGSSRWRGRAR